MVNWNRVLNVVGVDAMTKFSQAKLSTNQLSDLAVDTSAAKDVRFVLRNHGATYARRLARKALRRRNVVV